MPHHSSAPPTFKKKDRSASAGGGGAARFDRGVGRSLVQNYKGHIAPCEEVKSRDLVASRKQEALDRCAGYPLVFGLPRDRVMDSAQIAAKNRTMSAANPNARAETERYAMTHSQPRAPKESDYRTADGHRQVIDRSTGRPLIESVLSDETCVPARRTTGTRFFPQAYANSEANPDEVPRAARHEMESMPASYKTNLVRTLCMLYPKFTPESRIARQRQAHMTGAEARIYKSQALEHSPSRRGMVDEASRRATKQVCERPNNVRVVSLMRGAAPWAP